MYAEITSAIATAKTALDLARAAKGLSNYNELVSAVSEVNAKLAQAYDVALAAQEKLLSLTERNGSLSEELMKLKNLQAQAKDYSLQDVGGGVFAYVYKPIVQSTAPRHWACVNSFTEHNVGILQCERTHYKCALCGAIIEPVKDGRLPTLDSAYE